VTTAPPKPDLTYEDWEKISLAQAHAVEELTLRLGVWMMRAQRAEHAASVANERCAHWMKRTERAEQEVMRLLREREARK